MMLDSLTDPTTIADAYRLYTAHSLNDATSDILQIQTAIIRYTLPGMGFSLSDSKRLSFLQISEALEFMEQTPLLQLVHLMDAQKQVYDRLGSSVTSASKRTYRWALKRMLDWCTSQIWWRAASSSSLEKYAPPHRNVHNKLSIKQVRCTNKKRLPSYKLNDNEISPKLQCELNEFYDFLVDISWFGRQDPPLRDVTAKACLTHVLRIFGWLHEFKQVPLEVLSLNQIIDFTCLANKPTAKLTAKENFKLISEYIRWLRKEREVHPSSELFPLRSLVSVAKYLYHNETDYPDVKNYQDVPILVLLRNEINKTEERAKTTASPRDDSKKWLDWPKYLACVERLKAECAPKSSSGAPRNDLAIASSYQRYLIFAFLAYMPPDRQRTLRELEVGRTLIKREKQWYIHLQPDDYKTGAAYKEQWHLIPEILYPELEEWLNKWRLLRNPRHNFLFVQKDGKPMATANLTDLFRSAAYRLTGQVLTPQLVRDMAVTYFKKQGATDAEMESLASAMHHSREMQSRVYDRRTNMEKVAPAQDMMLRAAGVIAPKQSEKS